MTTDRPYRMALPRRRWRSPSSERSAGTQFDPAVVDALITVVHEPPPAAQA